MSARFIVNQDRDRIFRFDPSDMLYISPVIHEGVCYGNNVIMGSKLLGTFESTEAAMEEVSAIYHNTREIYAVSGFSNWRSCEPAV